MSSDSTDGQPSAPSVFGTRDQDEMIARIGSTAEDDLSSSFFDNSIQDVEDAAVRMFDVGIKTITEDPVSARAAFSATGAAAGGTPAMSPRGGVPGPVAAGADGRFADPAVRADFILGGPAAIGG